MKVVFRKYILKKIIRSEKEIGFVTIALNESLAMALSGNLALVLTVE